MPSGIFTTLSRYRKAARVAAILWTIGIFAGCLWPGSELPHSDIPFIDKWTHFVMFGGFAFLWLCAYPAARLWVMVLISLGLGIFVEVLQMVFASLGRSGDVMDALADGVGGLLGTALFWVGGRAGRRTISA